MATLAVTRRLDLTDEQWARLEPLLPVPTRSGRPSAWRNGSSSTGSGGGCGSGAPWRDVPDCYGSWRAVYALFRRWQWAGAWAQIVTALQTRADAAGLITWDVSVDSTIARAHQHAAGARRHPSQQQEPPGGLSAEPDDHALGRSRGGLTTKIHLAREQGQKVLSLVVTAGQRGDSPWTASTSRASAQAVPAHAPTRSGPTRPTAPEPTAPTCADAASPAPSPNQQTNNTTARTAAAEAAALPGSARTTTEPGTPSNAESTDSNATAPSPPDTTNSPSATKPSSTSPSSTTGF